MADYTNSDPPPSHIHTCMCTCTHTCILLIMLHHCSRSKSQWWFLLLILWFTGPSFRCNCDVIFLSSSSVKWLQSSGWLFCDGGVGGSGSAWWKSNNKIWYFFSRPLTQRCQAGVNFWHEVPRCHKRNWNWNGEKTETFFIKSNQTVFPEAQITSLCVGAADITFTTCEPGFHSVQFKMISMCTEKTICTLPHSSHKNFSSVTFQKIWLTIALSHAFMEDRWVLHLEHFIFAPLSPPGDQRCVAIGFVPAGSVSSSSALQIFSATCDDCFAHQSIC